MSLTEQVLLHRDAQLLGLQVVLEPTPSAPSSSSLRGVSRPGQLGGDFVKLFKLKQLPVFSIPVASTSVQKTSVDSSSLVSPTVTPTLVTLVPLATLVSPVKMPQAPLSSSSSTRTSVLSSACSTPSTLSSSNLEEEQVHLLGRDGILGKKGDRLSNSELGELSSNLVKNFVYDSVAPGTLKVYNANWQLFRSYGKLSGIDVDKYDFGFLIYL